MTSHAAAPEGSGAIETPSTRTSFGHRRALDGVRGLAVVLVIAFHGDFPWARGGYLGVSMFFTLSGFLITSLALVEFSNSGALAIGAFWMRRLRRLVPALLLALALCIVVVVLAGSVSARRALAADAIWAIAYAENWHWVVAGKSYGRLFSDPSPLLHLWSLGVEEQFYIVFPLVAAVVLRWGRWALGVVAGVVMVAGVVLPAMLSWSADRTYYGTDVRAGEIAMGVLAAVLIAGSRPFRAGAARVAMTIASCAALVAVIVCSSIIPTSWSGWSHGGFLVFAIASTLVVLAAANDVGPVARIGGARVLRRLGAVSYGLYLFHWPVFWLLAERTTWSPYVRFVVGCAIAYALASVSLRFVELPIRAGRVRRPRGAHARVSARDRAMVPLALATALVVIVAGSLWLSSGVAPAANFESMAAQLDAVTSGPVDERAVTVAFFGDSTSMTSALGATRAMEDGRWAGRFSMVRGSSSLGCGVLTPEANRSAAGRVYALAPNCLGIVEQWKAAIDATTPDLAVVELGRWEAWDMRIPGVPGWHALGDPVFDAWAKDQLRVAFDVLASRGATVVFLAPPSQSRSEGDGPRASDERLRRLDEIVTELAAESGGRLVIVDLAAWHAAQGARDLQLRPDGVHVSVDTGAIVADEFLLPALDRIAP